MIGADGPCITRKHVDRGPQLTIWSSQTRAISRLVPAIATRYMRGHAGAGRSIDLGSSDRRRTGNPWFRGRSRSRTATSRRSVFLMRSGRNRRDVRGQIVAGFYRRSHARRGYLRQPGRRKFYPHGRDVADHRKLRRVGAWTFAAFLDRMKQKSARGKYGHARRPQLGPSESDGP